MAELFANLLLHTYIAEKEPELLPANTVFPNMVVASTEKASLKYTTLAQLEEHSSGRCVIEVGKRITNYDI